MNPTDLGTTESDLFSDATQSRGLPDTIVMSLLEAPPPDSSRQCTGIGGMAGIVGSSRALQNALEMALMVAPTDSTVLIQGETGTGKELIAQAIHRNSPRRGHSFVKTNCAAIPHGLLESELFGHERGAFTGAITRRVGRFETAHRGSLFLDEVGDFPIEVQAKLLRVLQGGEFERLGGMQTVRADVRLIAATHQDLETLAKNGEFRDDLYYRLNVFPIYVPPLRARREDIAPLVMHFVRTFADQMNKTIVEVPKETMRVLRDYPWPGNIRELRNFVERSVILSNGPTLSAPIQDLKGAPRPVTGCPVTLEDAEREHIHKALKEAKWVVSGPRGAAARLGIKRSTLYFRMRKLGISRAPGPAPEQARWQ